MKKNVLSKVNRRPIALGTHVFNFVDFDVYFNHLYCMREWSQKYDIICIGMKGLQAASARNSIVERAMKENCSHILFLDGDHIIPVEMLDILWESRNQAMVSGLVNKKGETFQQIAWGATDDNRYVPLTLPLDGQLYEVGVCAFGCTLVNLDKMKRLIKPYFRDTCAMSGGELVNIRSDVNLCNMFRDAGEKIFIDTRILIGHHGLTSCVYPQNAEHIKRLKELENDSKLLKESQVGVYYK